MAPKRLSVSIDEKHEMNEKNQQQAPSRRLGGRSAQVVSAVYSATLSLLEEKGYDGFEIPEVAVKANVNKTSIYRRWPTKLELVADVARAQAKLDVPLPETGSLKGDLRALLLHLRTTLESPRVLSLLQLVIALGRQDVYIQRERDLFWVERFELSGKLVARAIERGELPEETKPREFLEFACSPLFFRALITRTGSSDLEIERGVSRSIKAFE
jgi:AcrR family transcriptional regulator